MESSLSSSNKARSPGEEPEEPEGAPIRIVPNDTDVLFGRGKPHVEHPGNKALHVLGDKYRPLYKEFGNKTAGIVDRKKKYGVGSKREIIHVIISSIEEMGGRFLRRDEQNEWMEVDAVEAQNKVSHLLRSQPMSSLPDKKPPAQGSSHDSSKNLAKRPRRMEPALGGFHPASYDVPLATPAIYPPFCPPIVDPPLFTGMPLHFTPIPSSYMGGYSHGSILPHPVHAGPPPPWSSTGHLDSTMASTQAYAPPHTQPRFRIGNRDDLRPLGLAQRTKSAVQDADDDSAISSNSTDSV